MTVYENNYCHKIFSNVQQEIHQDPTIFKEAILASTSIPGFFPPVLIGNPYYSDGFSFLIKPAFDAGCKTVFLFLNEPVNDDDVSLGSAALQFKNAWFDGTVNIDALVLATGATVTAVLDEDNMATNSATSLATQQSIKAYIDPTVTAVASDTTPNPTGDKKINELYITALAAAAEFAAPSGTPVNGNKLIIRVLDDGTGRALTYNAIYRAIGVTLPTTTTAGKTIYMGFIYNSADTKWDAVAVSEEA